MSSARRREAEHILKLCLGDHLRAYEVVERQLGALARRAQLLAAAAGAAVVAAGFAGRSLDAAGRIGLGAGSLLALLAAAVALLGVLPLRWLSQVIDDEPVVTLLRGLEVRDGRSRHLRRAAWILAAGCACALAPLLWAARSGA